MNILIASCVFPPEPVVSAKTSFDLADFFASRGNIVTVVCSKPNRNVSVSNFDYTELNFKVTNLPTFVTKSSSLFSRFLENFTFGFSLFLFIIFSKKVDVVYGNVWPIFSMFFLSLACRIKGVKLVLSIQDLYPETLVSQAKISNSGIVYKLLLWIDRYCAKTADHLIVISESFKRSYIQYRHVSGERISVVKNWQKSTDYKIIDKNIAKEKLGMLLNTDLKNSFTFIYGGNVGLASGVVDLVRCWIDGEMESSLIIAGGGSMIKDVIDLVAGNKKNNVFVLSPWLQEHTSEVYSAADVLILPIATGQEGASVPSKLMGYMLSKKPILMKSATESPASTDLYSAGGGLVVSDFDVKSIRYAELFFKQKSLVDLEKLADKNYLFALDNYDAKTALYKIEKLIFEVSRGHFDH